MDLTLLTDVDLKELETEVNIEKKRRHNLFLTDLANSGISSGNNYLKLLAEVVLSKISNESLSMDLVYELAEVYHEFYDKIMPGEQEQLRKHLEKVVDVVGYVFQHTHYDEFMNGYFYRRS
jgi:hypothetical protein